MLANLRFTKVPEVWDGRDVGWSTHVNVRSWKCWRSAALGLAALLSGAALLIIMHCFAPTETRRQMAPNRPRNMNSSAQFAPCSCAMPCLSVRNAMGFEKAKVRKIVSFLATRCYTE